MYSGSVLLEGLNMSILYIYIFALIKSNKCIYHFENCIFTLKVVKHSKHTQLQKEFQPPMLAPSMIMPVKITR